jgi:hypothetical protein
MFPSSCDRRSHDSTVTNSALSTDNQWANCALTTLRVATIAPACSNASFASQRDSQEVQRTLISQEYTKH